MNRKVGLVVLLSVFILILDLPNAISVVGDIGSPCPKLGAIKSVNSIFERCTMVGASLLWQKVKGNPSPIQPKPSSTATSSPSETDLFKAALNKAKLGNAAALAAKTSKTICAKRGICIVGGYGPGGGLIFFDARAKQWWGRYLEVAPKTWNGRSEDPTAIWCDDSHSFLKGAIKDPTLAARLGVIIGKGPANTDLMNVGCSQGAGVFAHKYRGGGKTDWFLPSKDELNLMYRNSDMIGDFSPGYYWSSSEYDANDSWDQNFVDGAQNLHVKNHSHVRIRPIRAF